jgi:hypothetical protein
MEGSKVSSKLPKKASSELVNVGRETDAHNALYFT